MEQNERLKKAEAQLRVLRRWYIVLAFLIYLTLLVMLLAFFLK